MTSEVDVGQLSVQGMRLVTALVDTSGQILYVSAGAEEITGYSNADLVGVNFNTLSGSPQPMSSEELMERARTEVTNISPLRHANGTIRMLEWRASILPQHRNGEIILVVGVDASDLEQAHSDFAMLDAFFHQAAFGFAIVDPQLRYIMLNQALADINNQSIAEHIGRPLRDIVESPDMELYEARLMSLLESGEPVRNLRISGTTTAGTSEPKVWGVSWFRLQDRSGYVFGLCGIIYDITDQEQATLEASRTRSRFALLSEANAVLGFSLDLQRTAQDFTDLTVNRFCDVAIVDVLSEVAQGEPLPGTLQEDHVVERIAASSKRCNPDVDILLQTEDRKLSETTAFSAAMASESSQLMNEPTADMFPNLQPEKLEAGRRLGLKYTIIAPLRARDLTLGAVTFFRNEERSPFTKEDVALANELANRVALCIENAHLYKQERHAALALQRSLLPRELPKLAEADVGYVYRPSSAAAQVGGDWCDVIPLPGRRVGLVIGDVMGHGISAAATMGRYRTAVQSLASVGLAPGVLLTRLNALAFEIGVDVIATCFYLVYDPAQHYATFACAGHPPPLLSPPGGKPTPLSPSAGPPLGTTRATAYTPTSTSIAPGSTLLCYTDGVVESRTAPLEVGINKLARLLANSSGTPQEVCQNILLSLPSDNGDDAALLLARFKGL
ncbi:MAG: SpoIIE family protein phosphatase [Corynebacteriales bacterium]|nr:SpoIIE family protein phosphatase [Mycobacteriales bacterium]